MKFLRSPKSVFHSTKGRYLWVIVRYWSNLTCSYCKCCAQVRWIAIKWRVATFCHSTLLWIQALPNRLRIASRWNSKLIEDALKRSDFSAGFPSSEQEYMSEWLLSYKLIAWRSCLRRPAVNQTEKLTGSSAKGVTYLAVIRRENQQMSLLSSPTYVSSAATH